MESLIYINKKNILLVDIFNIAINYEYESKFDSQSNHPEIRIPLYPGNWIIGDFLLEKGSWDSFTDDELDFLVEFSYPDDIFSLTMFILEYRTYTIEKLKVFFRLLLEKYGGIVVKYLYEKQEVYDINNINYLT